MEWVGLFKGCGFGTFVVVFVHLSDIVKVVVVMGKEGRLFVIGVVGIIGRQVLAWIVVFNFMVGCLMFESR